MSTTLTSLPAYGYSAPHSVTPSLTSLSSTAPKAPLKPKPVNVFSNDGSFLERFQRSKQEEEDRRKAEEALAKKKQFADRFKNQGKRPPAPDSSPAVTSTDTDPNPTKKPRLDHHAPQSSEHQKQVCEHTSHVLKDLGTGVRPPIK